MKRTTATPSLLLIASIIFSTELVHAGPGAPATARLTARSDASDQLNETLRYQWELQQSVDSPSFEVHGGRPTLVNFEIQAVRTLVERSSSHEITGHVCITNSGKVRTRSLEVWGGIQEKLGGTFKDITEGVTNGNPRATEVEPGSTLCLPFQLSADLRLGIEYRHHATICHVADAPICIESDAPFKVAETSKVTELNKTSRIQSVLSCPQGLYCSYTAPEGLLSEPFHQIPLQISVERVNQRTCTSGTMTHSVTLFGSVAQPLASNTTQAQLICSVGNPPAQCAGGSSFWSAHNTGKVLPDLLSPLLPVRLGGCGGTSQVIATSTQASSVFNQSFCSDGPSNGIGQLYSELLATQLNIARGTDVVPIRGSLLEVESFLVRHDCTDWPLLGAEDRASVQVWTSRLQQYNAGLLGPPSCGALMSE